MYRKGCGIRQRSRLLLVTLSAVFFKSTTTSFPLSSCLLSSRHISHSYQTKTPVSRHSHSIATLRNPSLTSLSSDMTTSSEQIGSAEMTAESTIVDNNKVDKSLFDQNIRLVALNIPAKLCTEYMKEFNGYLLKRPRMKRIFDAEKNGVKDDERRLILLSESNGDDLFLTNIPEELKNFNLKHGGVPEIFMLKISYENIMVDEVLRKILPENILEIPSSFEQVGHIAHLNLREEVLQYKYLIGNVILDKNSNIRTVVNKVGSIETEFRTFPMEVIAGKMRT